MKIRFRQRVAALKSCCVSVTCAQVQGFRPVDAGSGPSYSEKAVKFCHPAGGHGRMAFSVRRRKQMSTCPQCEGVGRVTCGVCWNHQLRVRCPECLGAGTVKTETGEETCPRCGGRTTILPGSCFRCGNNVPCPVCHGSGTVSD